jgi:predicted ABC-type ATPase
MPHVIVISGPNGAGKTTAAPTLLNETLHVSDFVNADTIAQGLSAFAPEKAAIQAGRTMLTRMRYLASQRENFAFETTLASRTFAPWLAKLKAEGYLFHLIFLRLEDADLAVSRVNERVRMGGHFVPEETVRRRYESGLKNFFMLYKKLADSWQMYDNSMMGCFDLIASNMNNKIDVHKPEIWHKLVEIYDKS